MGMKSSSGGPRAVASHRGLHSSVSWERSPKGHSGLDSVHRDGACYGLEGAMALTLSRNAPGAHPEQPGS